MANKITFNFVENIITLDIEEQRGTELCPDLSDRKDQILKVIGCEQINVANELTVDFVNNTVASNTELRVYPGLSDRREQILDAMGYEWVDISTEVAAINNYVNGAICCDELLKILSQEE